MPPPKKELPSKMDMMREAVAKLGKDAPLTDLLKSIKDAHGFTLDRAVAYTYKGLASKQKAGKPKGKPGRKPGPKPGSAAGRSIGITVEDIAAVKALAYKIGTEKVQELAKVLAK